MPEDKPTSDTAAPFHISANAPTAHTSENSLRGSLRRANWSVGGIVLTSLLLTIIAVVAGLRSARSQYRAEQAEANGRERLWRAYLAQARAARLSGAIGRRAEALTAISNAATLHISKEVRDEAIASHLLTDLALEKEVCPVSLEESLVEFATGLEKYAIGSLESDFKICRTRDQTVLHRLERAAAGLQFLPTRDRRAWQYVFSPDGNYFALSLADGALAVWELTDGRVIFQHAPKAAGEIQICFSQDSARLGFHNIDRAGDLVIVDLPSRSMSSQSFSLRGAPFALLPEANQFALAAENEIKIVQLDTGELLQRIHSPEAVTSLLASPDGRKLAATCHGTDVYLWNLEARELYVLRSHTERNTTLEFSPASDVLMSSSLDNVTCLWDCATGRELLRATECNGLDFSRDGRHLGCLVERRELAIYQLTGGAALRTLAGPGPRDQQLNRFDLSPDGNLFAAILNGGLEIWTLDSAQAASFFPMADARALTFFPDGNSLLLARAGVGLERVMVEITPVTGTPDTTVRLGVHEKIGLPDSVSIQQVALSSDARTVCLDLDDRRMLVADLRGEREPVFLSERARYNFRLAPAGATGSGRFGVSPDGRYVAVGYGLRKHPLVFNARTGEVVTELPVAPGTVVFDHNGQHLLTSGANEYSLWRVADWQRVWKRTFESLGTQWGCMSFSGDDRWVALNLDRHRLALLDAARGETLSVLTPPDPQTIGGIRLAHDSGRLVAPTFNNLVQVWNLTALRRELAPLGFDCTTPFRAQAPVAFAPGGTLPGSAAAITFGVTAAICLGVLTVAVLRRHRRLAEEFVETEARAFRHERELQVQRELNRLKSNFVSMVSHEFRTPLGVIQSSAEILQAYFDRLKTEKRTEHLAEIVQSTTRMKDLMEEVLLLSRVDSGRMECKPALLDLRSLAQRVCAELKSSTERRCPIHFEEHALDDAPARVDERLLTIVLSNLLSNAVKYSPAGLPVQLSIRRAPREVIFEISDHGMGIPEVDQQYLFSTTFHRGSNVGHIPGTGLGLTIVKRCAELHGGTVSFTSTEGRGTTFVLRLPV